MIQLQYNKETCEGSFYGKDFNLSSLPENERNTIQAIFSHYITKHQDFETLEDKYSTLEQKINDIKTALYD